MKNVSRIFASLALIAAFALAAPVAGMAASDREEVAQRIELNNATADQLAATGAVSKEQADAIINLREQLGSFQAYEDLDELNIPKEQFDKLRFNTTIAGIASDCNC